MKVATTGGGTAGHVTPLLAVASEIKSLDKTIHIRYIGERGKASLNQIAQDSQDIDKTYKIFSGKLRRFHGKKISWYFTQPALVFRNIRDIFLIGIGTLEALLIFLFWRPDVLFAKGGYVSLPVGLAAAFYRIPIVTHDSDTLPGLTNRVLSRYATKLAVGQPPEYYPNYPQNKLEYVGVPIANKFFDPPSQKKARTELGLDVNKQTILVTGGSLGAVRLNDAVANSLSTILDKPDRQLVWACGDIQFKELRQLIDGSSYKNRILLLPFVDKMDLMIQAADVVISRTGATSLAEIAALKKATILVPNPFLTGGHQLTNAKAYQKHQAAIVLLEADLKANSGLLGETLDDILSDNAVLSKLQLNISKFAVKDSSQKLARLIVNVGSR